MSRAARADGACLPFLVTVPRLSVCVGGGGGGRGVVVQVSKVFCHFTGCTDDFLLTPSSSSPSSSAPLSSSSFYSFFLRWGFTNAENKVPSCLETKAVKSLHFKASAVAYSSVQSHDRLGRRGDMTNDAAVILFHSFLQEAILSSFGMGRPGCPLSEVVHPAFALPSTEVYMLNLPPGILISAFPVQSTSF